VELGRTFAKALKETTTDLKMGFGSFVDKPVMPFASQSHIKNPLVTCACAETASARKLNWNPLAHETFFFWLIPFRDRGLRPVYGFENKLKLTLVNRNDPVFERTVRMAKISVNLDAPEGGLDAMMQVLECWDEIGRRQSRRIKLASFPWNLA